MNVHTYELLYLGNGTSDHRNEKTKTLCNRKYPPKPRKTHLRNHFCPLESGFSAIATYKTYDNFLGPQCPIYTSTFSELMGHSRQIPWCSFFAFFCHKKLLQDTCVLLYECRPMLCIHRRSSDFVGSHFSRLDSLHIHTILTAITWVQALNIDFMDLDGASKILVSAQ